MKRSLLPLICALVLSPFIAPPAHAAECIDGCIDVYTENGKLIIEGRKGSGPISKRVLATPKAKTVAKKVPTKKVPTKKVVKPKARSSYQPPITVKKPTVKKSAPRKKPTAKATPKPKPTTESLADRLIKLLPTPGLQYQPGYEPLVNMPVYFSSGLPESFNTVVDVIGERVSVKLVPHFHYNFGDGTTLDTTNVGGFYPDGKVTHTYKQPGEYNVRVDIVWGGVFITKGLSKAVRGAIELVVNAPITVVATTNRFMN